MQERLDKLISAQSGLSRKDAVRAIRDSRVTVNGASCRESDRKVDPDSDRITLDGAVLRCRRTVYYMMYKPKGVVSATEDKAERTVLDLLPPELGRRGLFPAGRLDKDTTGLLILTDDGDYAHRMLAPKKHVDKTYIAALDREPDQAALQAFAQGIVLGDGTVCKSGRATALGDRRAEVVISEGKYHQVKRMFAAVGFHVEELERVRIGALELDRSLSPGEVREMTIEEAQKVFEIPAEERP